MTWRTVAIPLCCASALVVCVQCRAFAQGQKPLPTQYVDCVTNTQGVPTKSRTVRTPTFTSSAGIKAYAVVTALAIDHGCKNSTSVYAGKGAQLSVAYQQPVERLPDGTSYDGNGVEALSWSPSGERLLVEISQWTWGTDFGWNTKYILLNSHTDEVKALPVSAAVEKQFPHSCQRRVASNGWLNETQIEIEVNPTRAVDEEGVAEPTPPCVEKPTRFAFDVPTGTLRPLN